MIGIEKNGYIAFATCSQHINDEIFSEIIETAAIKSKRKNIIIYTGTQAKDHPIIAGMKETKYLRFILLKVI
jgi:23S rRNA (cytosine1962-C5)-methyltransferase